MRYITEKKESFKRVCKHCRMNIELYRNADNKDVVYYDGSFYHKSCFIDMGHIVKKCKCCGSEILINSPSEDVVFYDQGFSHLKCFEDKCNLVKTTKWSNAKKFKDTYQSEAKKRLEEQFDKKKVDITTTDKYAETANIKIKEWFDGSDVDSFIKENYNLKVLPPQIYSQYLRPVYNGTYRKAPGIKIPACDLLDMWKQKKNELVNIHKKNITNGKRMTDEQIIAYDLTVLVRKYNSYLKWKENQRILESENTRKVKERKTSLNTSIINEASFNNEKNIDSGISDLVDDIFD